MTNTQIKAQEMVSRFGHDMARVRARHLAERGSGPMRRWWEEVLRAIAGTDPARRAA